MMDWARAVSGEVKPKIPTDNQTTATKQVWIIVLAPQDLSGLSVVD